MCTLFNTQPSLHLPRQVFTPCYLGPSYLVAAAITILGVCSFLLLSPTQTVAEERQMSDPAMQQMRVLLDEKARRTPTQKKMSSAFLLSSMRRQKAAMMNAVPNLRTSVALREDDTTLVDIKVTGVATAPVEQQIKTVGGTVVNSFSQYQSIRAQVPVSQLEKLAELREVTFIRPADQYQIHKTDTSEGDRAHRADIGRADFGVDGTGVRIGIISDSIEALSSLQTSGDLPAVTVLPGQASNGTSEGTAMLEIVHDLAPGAQLFFATANGGQPQFAQNILDLQAAGCDVIVDDVGYFAEPVFQDGIIARAVNEVITNGAQYYSSAGNSGNLNDGTSGVWEGDFVPMPAPGSIPGQNDAHDFGGGVNFNRITQDSPSVFTLQWSDPHGGSANDYDLFLLNSDLSTVFDSSTNVQDGNDDPFEQISSLNFNDSGNVLVIVRNPGAANRFLHLNTNRGRLTLSTDGQTSGHSAAVDAFSVAAVNVATAANGTFSGGMANPVETFSSDGPRRVFYEPNGNPITPGNVSSTGGRLRQKPDIAAADGVSTATSHNNNTFNPFFGTSAAAPHAAAIGGLLLERNPNLTPDQVRTIFNATALDIEGPGVDRDSGVGIIMADAALREARPPSPRAELSVEKTASLIPATLVYTLTVNNAGPGDAQDVVVTQNLPNGVTLVSTSGCAEDGNGVPTCTLGTIAAGASKQYTITGVVTAATTGLLDPQPTISSSTTNLSASGGKTKITIPVASGAGAGQGQEVNIDISIRVPIQ